MEDERQNPEATSASIAETTPRISATVLHVAWLAILVGLGMEDLLLLLTAGFGLFSSLKSVAADLVRQGSWSLVVCVGLSLGTAASKLRAPLMGLLGLFAAPVAFGTARSLHEGTKKVLEIAGSTSSVGFSLPLALEGVEYGCLGIALDWIGQRAWGGIIAYIAVGLIVGLLFEGLALVVTYWGTPSPLSAVALISLGSNEMLFPIGCSLVLYSVKTLGKRVTR